MSYTVQTDVVRRRMLSTCRVVSSLRQSPTGRATLASSPTRPQEDALDNFIHAGNLAIFKKRLAEVLSPAERKILLELQAEELARNPSPKK